jgi:glycosyltransferase involved in cell wall biosynthesis
VDPREFFPRPEIEKASVRQKYGLPNRFFLYVGSLEPRKNLASAIRAMDQFRGEEKLVVVGAGGWMNSDLHELIEKHRDKVFFLGYVPQSDLAPLYSAAKATVYPSLYEGFGLPVVESMACGTPVLTSDNSSLAEIASGAALLLRQPSDPEEIALALARLAEDATLRQDLAALGRDRALLYIPEHCAAATIQVFHRLLCDL